MIKIEPANPQVVYVPTYNPTVVYGAWPYPTYPPYAYYPPGYAAATAAFSFTAGVALGAAWGYAWGDATGAAGMSTSISTATPILTRISTARGTRRIFRRAGKVRKARGGMTLVTGGASRIGIKGPRSGSTEAPMRKPRRRGRRFAAGRRSGRQELARGGADRIGQAGARDRVGAGSHASGIGAAKRAVQRGQWAERRKGRRPRGTGSERWTERARRWRGTGQPRLVASGAPGEADRQRRSRDLGRVARCVTRARVAPRSGGEEQASLRRRELPACWWRLPWRWGRGASRWGRRRFPWGWRGLPWWGRQTSVRLVLLGVYALGIRSHRVRIKTGVVRVTH